MTALKLAALDGVVIQHTWYECKGQCGKSIGCMFCDGGLGLCTICASFEGATTTHCVGRKMSQVEVDLVYAGKLDWIDGGWVPQASGSCMSHFEVKGDVVYLNGKVYK